MACFQWFIDNFVSKILVTGAKIEGGSYMKVEECIFTFNQLFVLVLHDFFIKIYDKVLDR